jgi:toxin-antitoxin system PIN domain toxin
VVVVDTNVLVYAARTDSPFHAPCREALERLRAQPGAWYATWSILYEFMRVVTHRGPTMRPWSLPAAWDFIEALRESPGFDVLVATGRHAAVAREVFGEHPDLSGRRVHDAHIAILMREHGIRRIYTRDTDFHRFPFIEPVDPVREAPPPGASERVARYRGAKRRRTAPARARP